MKLHGVHHVSLNVRDVEEAVGFYAEVLGMAPLERPDLGFPGAWLACGAQQLHLMRVEGHQAPEGQHVAFAVEDLDAALEVLAAAGVRASGARPVPGGGRHAFLRDPSGNLLELQQPAG